METIIWTDYLIYRARLRGFDIETIEEIIRYSSERYFDTITDRQVIVGKHSNILVMLPHEADKGGTITPITIHATTRQQINYRVKSGAGGLKMNEPKLAYCQEVDILHLSISDELKAGSVEISPNVTAELNDKGELIGIEIIDTSSFLRYSILETGQAKLLQLAEQVA